MKINVFGQCEIECVSSKGCRKILTFYIVKYKHGAPAVLGLGTCQSLNLIKKKDSIENSKGSIKIENRDVLDGLGEIKKFEYQVKLRNDAQPKVDAMRKVPIQLQEPVEEELKRMKRLGVIREVIEPTEWVSSMVLAKPLVCLDPQNLSQALMREYFHLPRLRESWQGWHA